ncbi:MAG: TolC family protein [Steroidobacteraceae bacterium]|nr:TolC family protein [Steroidobacteraceae bacterium]
MADLLAEAIRNNPEIAAARSERDAAQQRISPAGAFDDPMLEAGVVNAPLPSLSLSREEMTMKMLGLGQKLPYPGKRDLRRSVAAADARSVEFALQEAINRTARDVRITYADLGFNTEARRILADTEAELVQLAAIARSRYDVGQAVQNDVLDAQTEVERLRIQRLQLEREAAALQAEMRRLLGRVADGAPIIVSTPDLIEAHPDGATLHDEALDQRPQLLALETQIERGDKAVALAEREYYPDFDVRLQYGQRDRAPDGMPRDDMVTLTVALNLPIWRKSRLEPMVAEARAMRNGARSMLVAQQLETRTAIDTRVAEARQWRDTAELYRGTVLPRVRASVVSALAAYRVGRVDFLTLRQAQLRELEVSTQLAEAIASHNKAVAELDLLLGRSALLPTD